MKRIRVKGGMQKLRMSSIVGIAGVNIMLSSCAQTPHVEASTPSLEHSSSDVLSLQEYENAKLRKERRSGGFLNFLLDGILGSSPDDEHDLWSDERGARNRKKREEFIRENGDTLVRDLESKKD